MSFLKRLFGGGKEKPVAKWETLFWKENRFTVLIDNGVVQHIIVWMYFPHERTKENAAERKRLKEACAKQLKEMYGDIAVPVNFKTTDLTRAQYLKQEADKLKV